MLTVIGTLCIYLLKQEALISRIVNINFMLFLLFLLIIVIVYIFSVFLLPIIILNRESGQSISYPKMIQYLLSRFIPIVITNALLTLIVFIGSILLIIPGIIWQYTFSQAHLFTLIDGFSPIQSLKLSRRATQGSKMKIFNLTFLMGVIYGVPLAVLSIFLTAFKIPEFLILNMALGVFGSCLYSVTNYVIWKRLKQKLVFS